MELPVNRIHQGDCIKGLQQLPGGVVDLAFADPPFNIGYSYDVYNDNQDYKAYLEWTKEWMSQVCRVLKASGTFWVAIGDEYAAEIKLIAQNDLKLCCRSWVIWYYTFGVNCTKKFTRSHAHLFYFVKDPKNFTFNDGPIRVPSARQLVYADSRANPAGRLPDDTWILRPQDLPEGFSPEEDTWYFPRVAGTFKERAGFHGCQMPERLLARIVECCSNENALVLDPFTGSGTTLVVAKKLGRQWLGFELSENYAKQAAERIERVQVGQLLEGAAQPLHSAPATPVSAESDRQKSSSARPTGPRNMASPSCAAPPVGVGSETHCGVLAAFLATRQGYSSDRVIADPELNERFLERCRASGVEGGPAAWNRILMRLRKSSKLTHCSTAKRTHFPIEEFDCYAFASEIAMRRLLDEGGCSLDDFLCDPELARKFDGIARSFAPGFSPLQYRWAALTIRKRAHQWRRSSRELPAELGRRKIGGFYLLAELRVEDYRDTAGVYFLREVTKRPLYVGGTLDLAKRIGLTIQAAGEWRKSGQSLEVGVLRLEGVEAKERCGLQSRLIKKYAPHMNLLELGA